MSSGESPPIPLVVFGANGRMGKCVCSEAASSPHSPFRVVGAIAHAASASVGKPSVPGSADAPFIESECTVDCSAIIDFSTPEGTERAIATAIACKAVLLIATTGLQSRHWDLIHEAANAVPILVAPNTSLGVAISLDLVERATSLLGPDTRIEIIESHHQHKKDAPSGTAIALSKAVELGGGTIQPDQIHALRGGDVVGEHTVRFFGEDEYFEITHVANSRSLFAAGALKATSWLYERGNRQPGLYSMQHVLGLR